MGKKECGKKGQINRSLVVFSCFFQFYLRALTTEFMFYHDYPALVPSFLPFKILSQTLPYSFESSKMGKEDMPIESEVQWKHGKHPKALSRHFSEH